MAALFNGQYRSAPLGIPLSDSPVGVKIQGHPVHHHDASVGQGDGIQVIMPAEHPLDHPAFHRPVKETAFVLGDAEIIVFLRHAAEMVGHRGIPPSSSRRLF